jgi:hypothetical protein
VCVYAMVDLMASETGWLRTTHSDSSSLMHSNARMLQNCGSRG